MTASYGWGVVPVVATIGGTEFATSLFPRDGSYLLPVKLAVQKAEGIGLGDRVAVVMRVGRPAARCSEFAPWQRIHTLRSEERRVGNECVSPCSSGGTPIT